MQAYKDNTPYEARRSRFPDWFISRARELPPRLRHKATSTMFRLDRWRPGPDKAVIRGNRFVFRVHIDTLANEVMWLKSLDAPVNGLRVSPKARKERRRRAWREFLATIKAMNEGLGFALVKAERKGKWVIIWLHKIWLKKPFTLVVYHPRRSPLWGENGQERLTPLEDYFMVNVAYWDKRRRRFKSVEEFAKASALNPGTARKARLLLRRKGILEERSDGDGHVAFRLRTPLEVAEWLAGGGHEFGTLRATNLERPQNGRKSARERESDALPGRGGHEFGTLPRPEMPITKPVSEAEGGKERINKGELKERRAPSALRGHTHTQEEQREERREEGLSGPSPSSPPDLNRFDEYLPPPSVDLALWSSLEEKRKRAFWRLDPRTERGREFWGSERNIETVKAWWQREAPTLVALLARSQERGEKNIEVSSRGRRFPIDVVRGFEIAVKKAYRAFVDLGKDFRAYVEELRPLIAQAPTIAHAWDALDAFHRGKGRAFFEVEEAPSKPPEEVTALVPLKPSWWEEAKRGRRKWFEFEAGARPFVQPFLKWLEWRREVATCLADALGISFERVWEWWHCFERTTEWEVWLDSPRILASHILKGLEMRLRDLQKYFLNALQFPEIFRKIRSSPPKDIWDTDALCRPRVHVRKGGGGIEVWYVLPTYEGYVFCYWGRDAFEAAANAIEGLRRVFPYAEEVGDFEDFVKILRHTLGRTAPDFVEYAQMVINLWEEPIDLILEWLRERAKAAIEGDKMEGKE